MSTSDDVHSAGNHEWFVHQIDWAIDPRAKRCSGSPYAVIHPILSRRWRTELPAPRGLEELPSQCGRRVGIPLARTGTR